MKSVSSIMLIAASLFASTSAFVVPSSPLTRVNSLKMAADGKTDLATLEVTKAGISQPFPNMFDPLGFAKKADIKTLKKYRESELKHGRVAMLAIIGVIIQELGFTPFYNTPEFETEQYVDLGPAAFQFQALEKTEPFVIVYLVVLIGITEAISINRGWDSKENTVGMVAGIRDDYVTGDLQFDPLGFGKFKTEEEFITARTKELNNGRMAMIAWVGMMVQELITHQKIF